MSVATSNYAPYEVYKNIREFIRYRNATTDHKFKESGEFVTYIKHNEYIVIPCKTQSEFKNLIIIITVPDAKAATKTQDFEKMMNGLNNSVAQDVLKSRPEILIITEQPLTNFIMKKIGEIKNNNKENGEPFIRNQQYNIFKIIVPEHPQVPKQSIMPEDEVKEFEQTFHCSRNDLPKIRLNEPISIWLGARPGQVIKSMRMSETVGFSLGYRVVIA